MPPLSFITRMRRSAKPNTTCSGGFAAPSVAANRPQTVPESPATAAPPQKPYFSNKRTRTPAFAAVQAAARPAAPPPTTRTSALKFCLGRSSLTRGMLHLLHQSPDRDALQSSKLSEDKSLDVRSNAT